MSLLQFGVAPKMKPISRKRAALVAALDVGTSKVVCVIAQAGAEPAATTCCGGAAIRSR